MAASGDTRAFAAIYERYHQTIYRYCHSILHHSEDAADALQNTMVKAMRALEGHDRDIALKPWLFRIAHNEAISLVRRRRPTASIESVEGPLAPSVDEDAATRERLGQLVSDLRELPERQRGALLMRELAGLEFGEIAQAFDVSPAAAKQTVYEARTALHEYVEGRRMLCRDAREALSAGDRRMLRGRKLSAHMRDCAGCLDFEELMRLRRRDVAALAPTISAAGSAAVLNGILGGGGGSAGGGGVGTLVGGSSLKALIGSQGAKSLLVTALLTAGAGALGVVSTIRSQAGPRSTSAPARVEQAPAAARPVGGGAAQAAPQGGAAHRSSLRGSHQSTSPRSGSPTGSASGDSSGGAGARPGASGSSGGVSSQSRRTHHPRPTRGVVPVAHRHVNDVVAQVTQVEVPTVPSVSALPTEGSVSLPVLPQLP
jgi:RNA polymerase sigma factor (sigma-70 family)